MAKAPQARSSPALSADPWEAIIHDPRPRPALSALADHLEAELKKDPEQFPLLTEESLRRRR